MIKNTGAALLAASAAALSGCSMSPPPSDSRRHQEVTVEPQTAGSIAYMRPEGGFLLNGEEVSRLSPGQKPDFIIDNERGVWEKGPDISSCQGGFAIPSIQAFGTYYIPASQNTVNELQQKGLLTSPD